jgi:hypothetical protein
MGQTNLFFEPARAKRAPPLPFTAMQILTGQKFAITSLSRPPNCAGAAAVGLKRGTGNLHDEHIKSKRRGPTGADD